MEACISIQRNTRRRFKHTTWSAKLQTEEKRSYLLKLLALADLKSVLDERRQTQKFNIKTEIKKQKVWAQREWSLARDWLYYIYLYYHICIGQWTEFNFNTNAEMGKRKAICNVYACGKLLNIFYHKKEKFLV